MWCTSAKKPLNCSQTKYLENKKYILIIIQNNIAEGSAPQTLYFFKGNTYNLNVRICTCMQSGDMLHAGACH